MSSESALACLQKVSAEILNGGRSSNGSRAGGGGLRGADRRPLARGGVLLPAREVHRAGERGRPGHPRAVQRGALPGVLQGVRGPAHLGCLLAHDAGHQQPAVLEVVRRRPAERLLQLRRPAPGDQPQQGGVHLGARAGDRGHQGDHLPGAVPPGQRVRRAAAGLLRPEDRRPGDLPPADGPRAAGLDARLRPPRGHPLGGVRRLQRRGVRRPDRRLGQPHPGDDGRLLPQRRADRPQGQGRRGGGDGPRAGCRGRQGAGLATPPRPVRVEQPHGRRPRLLRRRAAGGLPRQAWSSRSPCRPRRRCS